MEIFTNINGMRYYTHDSIDGGYLSRVEYKNDTAVGYINKTITGAKLSALGVLKKYLENNKGLNYEFKRRKRTNKTV